MTEHRIDLSQLARARDGSGHSVYGPSGSSIYLNCVGSLVPSLFVADPGNPDAAYGTVAHYVTEVWGKSGIEPVHMIGEKHTVGRFEVEIDDEMLMHAKECIDRCEFEPGDQLWEEWVDFSNLTPIPNQGGTLDFAAMRPGILLIVDHKFGKHKTVYARFNSQLMLYAYGIVRRYGRKYRFERIIIRINQPRINHYDEWECTIEELMDFVIYASRRMHEAWAIDAPRTPGEVQCEYCKIRNECPANAKMQAELTEGVFQNESVTPAEMEEFLERVEDDEFALVPVDLHKLTTVHIAKLHAFRNTAKQFWNRTHIELMRRMEAGESLTPVGLKLVEGRSIRRWTDHEAARKVIIDLGVPFDEASTEETVSPAQAEKLIGKYSRRRKKDIPELLGRLITKPPGKLSLAPLADPRPAIENINTDDIFGDESEEDDYI